MKKFFKITTVAVMTLTALIACGCGKEKQKTEKYYPEEIRNNGDRTIPDPHPEFLPPARSDDGRKVIFLKIDFPFERGEWIMAIRRPHKNHRDDKDEQKPQNPDGSAENNTPSPQPRENDN